MKLDFDDNNLLPLLLILICLCGDNGFNNIFNDYVNWLPWLVVILCCCDNPLDDLFNDIEDWLPWLLIIYCCIKKC